MAPQAPLPMTPMQQSEMEKLCHAVPATQFVGKVFHWCNLEQTIASQISLKPLVSWPWIKKNYRLLFTGDYLESLHFNMSAESCMQDIYYCLVKYCTTQDGYPRGKSLSPSSQNLFLLLILSASCSCLASESSQLSAGSYEQTKPKPPCKELERFLHCTMAPSPNNTATASNARGQCSRCSLQHSQNGELGDLSFPGPSLQLALWHWHLVTNCAYDNSLTLMEIGPSFQGDAHSMLYPLLFSCRISGSLHRPKDQSKDKLRPETNPLRHWSVNRQCWVICIPICFH